MAETPYTPRILELSARLAALRDAPTPEMFTPEEIEARKAKQARDEALAMLAKLSGDKPLQSVGTALLPEALKAAAPRYTEHGEFEPLSGRHRIFPEYTRRVQETRLQNELNQTEMKDLAAQQAAAAAKQREEAMKPYKDAAAALQQARADDLRRKAAEEARKRAEGKPLQGKALTDMTKLGKDVDDLAEVRSQFAKNFNFDSSLGISKVGAAQDWAASNFPELVRKDWAQNRLAWGTLQRLKEIKDRHENFGATLTENEKRSWDQVTPPRGAGKAKIDEWLDQQEKLLVRAIQHSAAAAAAAGGHKKQIETLTRGLWKAPVTEAPPPAEELPTSDADFVYVPGKGTVPSKR